MSIIDRTLNNKLNLIYHNLINDINQLEQHKVIPMFNMWIKHKYTEYYKDYDKKHAKDLLNQIYEKLLGKTLKNLKISKKNNLITYEFKKTIISIYITSISKGQINILLFRK